jgi:hypothetical protein
METIGEFPCQIDQFGMVETCEIEEVVVLGELLKVS